MIEKIIKYRWPIGIVTTLAVVIAVNLAFTWVAISDDYGARGFQRVDHEEPAAENRY